MAQAMPRYCPRCGTPTRANMGYCATCELPVEAMLSRPGDKQSWSGERAGAAPQAAQPDPMALPTPRRMPQRSLSEPAVVPTPRQMQQGDQPFHPPHSPMPQDVRSSWDISAEETITTQIPPSSPGRGNAPEHSPLPPSAWDASRDPGAQPWAASQAEPHFSPAADAWNVPDSASSSGDPNAQAPWATQIEPMRPPLRTPAPQPEPRRRASLIAVLLVLLLVLGGGYLAFSLLGGHFPGLGNSQSAIKTSNLNLNFSYAGMNVTLLSVQQAQNFLDDPQSASDGMLRLKLQEQNKTSIAINWNYNTSARLLVQGRSALAPTYVKSKQSIAPGATQTSEIDFAVPNGGNLNSIVFQLGTASEAQMRIPLTAQANLSQYQPKITSQKGTMVYFGLNWTLTGTTTSLSIPGQQASKGMEYLTLNLKIDNTLSQDVISGSPFDYMQVKAGGQTAALVATTLPVSFTSGETGKTGTATFLVPQNSTACTLILLSQDPGGSGQATTNFQL